MSSASNSYRAAASQARGRLDEVIVGDVEELELDFGHDNSTA